MCSISRRTLGSMSCTEKKLETDTEHYITKNAIQNNIMEKIDVDDDNNNNVKKETYMTYTR